MKRYSDFEIYGFRFPAKQLKTPTLNHYFKKVYIDPFIHYAIFGSRVKLGLPIYE